MVKEQTRRSPLIANIVVLLFAIGFAAMALTYYQYATTPPSEVLDIQRGYFHPSDDIQPPPADAPGWIPVSFPHDWSDHEQTEFAGWYTFDLNLKVPPNRLWGIYLPRVTSNVAAYLNDEEIGSGGRFREPVARNGNRPLYFSIPNGVLHTGNNRFSLRVKASHGSPGYLGVVYLGADESLRPVYERSRQFRVSLVENTTVGLVACAILLLGLWVKRRKDTLLLWFSLLCIVWALHNLNLLVVEIPVSTRVWECFRYLTLGWFSVLMVTSMHRFIGFRHPVSEYSIYLIAFVGSIVLCYQNSQASFVCFANWVWLSAALLLGLYPAVRISIAWLRSWNPEFLIGMLAGAPILLAGTHDWLRVHGYIERDTGYFIQYTAPALLFGFSIVLLIRYARAMNQSEEWARTLELRVEEKRQQLEENYKRLNMLERDHVLASERERIMRDMHDGVGGHLVSALAMTENSSLKTDRLHALLSNALTDLRLMIDSLDQTDGDLVSVLGVLRARMQSSLEGSGIQVNWKVVDLPAVDNLGPDRILHIMRILQEAITNVLKHSGAQTLTVITGETGDLPKTVFIEIRDDGCGLSDRNEQGHGLRNMRYRAERAMVKLEISGESDGTRVRILVPIEGVDPQ